MNKNKLPSVMLLLLCGAPLLLTYTKSTAQSVATDSRGKDVFNFYKSESISIPASSATGSFKVAGTVKLGGGTQFFTSTTSGDFLTPSFTGSSVSGYTQADSAKLTVAKSLGLNGSVSVSNLKSNLSAIETFHPSYGFSIGIGRNIDAFNNWTNISQLRFPRLATWNISLSGTFDNVLIYDSTIRDTSNRKHPFTLGITTEGSIYPANWLILSGSLTYEYTSNLSDLKTYQANKPFYSDNNVISLDDYVGKLGDFKRINSIRFRLSSPILFPALHFIQPIQLCIIPYFNLYGTPGNKLKNIAGVFVSVLGKNFIKKIIQQLFQVLDLA